jgi:carbamoyltransferase
LPDQITCLGLGGSNHDYAACIVRDGKVAVAIEEERLSGNKYAVGDNSLFLRSRKYCLSIRSSLTTP